jgi:hypothetical protein
MLPDRYQTLSLLTIKFVIKATLWPFFPQDNKTCKRNFQQLGCKAFPVSIFTSTAWQHHWYERHEIAESFSSRHEEKITKGLYSPLCIERYRVCRMLCCSINEKC